MKEMPWQGNWTEITESLAHEITGSTVNPGKVFSYPISDLPSSLQKLPGLSMAYVSGHLTHSLSPEDIVVQGEVVLSRIDFNAGIGKGYVFPFGISGSKVYFSGPYKPYDGHYFQTGSAVPVEKLFGKVKIPEVKTDKSSPQE